MPDTTPDHQRLFDQRFEVSTRIEKLLLRRDILGEWTPPIRAEYVELCQRERMLIECLTAERLIMV
jgi:hypothetical protein